MEQVVLAGYDTLIRIFDPKYYQPASTGSTSPETEDKSPMHTQLGPFLRRAKLRVTLRPGDEWGGAAEQRSYLDHLLQGDGARSTGEARKWADRIELVEGHEDGNTVISSTYARDAAQDRDWPGLRRLVSPTVGALIEEQALYVP